MHVHAVGKINMIGMSKNNVLRSFSIAINVAAIASYALFIERGKGHVR
jgi:hypothetical protein